MKILILSWYFPPTSSIGAVRLGSLARFLADRGHDVRVIAGIDDRCRQDLDPALPGWRVTYASWSDVGASPAAAWDTVKAVCAGARQMIDWPRIGRGSKRSPAGSGAASASPAPRSPLPAPPPEGGTSRPGARPADGNRGFSLRSRLSAAWASLIYWPDSRIGWLPHALRAGNDLLETWRPDCLLASAPPFTTLLAADHLGRRFGLPVVLEFRDRWSEDPYYPPPWWRRRLNAFVERRAIRHAKALVTVSEPWAAEYERVHGKPVAVIYNGYLPDGQNVPPVGSPDVTHLRIVYAGHIYEGYRDPTPLFAAIASDRELMENVRVDFYGTDERHVRPLADAHGINGAVKVHPRVAHAEALNLQRQADVLLLMQWNDPQEEGNLPGKLFEYLGAQRPILALGFEHGTMARIVRGRNAGTFCNDPMGIAAQLRTWLDEKRSTGRLPQVPDETRKGFSRSEQFAKLEGFLRDLL